MKKIISACILLLPLSLLAQGKIRATPGKLYGQLLVDVQLQQIFPDGKTFVDCIPKRKPADIMYDYGMMRGPNFDLKSFVADNFTLPETPQLSYIQREKDPVMHIKNLWAVLRREADAKSGESGSLIALPHPYIVPGGRFREIYYWDSYFTMLGLKESGEVKMMEDMIDNFESLINQFGHIPTGNRTYHISRSQPPFFCMMVNLLAGIKGKQVYKKYLPAMQKEYAFWMEGSTTVKAGEPFKRVVKMADGTVMNRYWDDENTARDENYKIDTETADSAAQQLAMLIRVSTPEKLKEILDKRRASAYSDIRAAVCSGWDFGSRWLKEPAHMWSIQTTKLIPVDLNCLMYSMESIIATAALASGNSKLNQSYSKLAVKRKAAILKYCWNKEQQYFVDYNIEANQPAEQITAAGLFPLFLKIATAAQAAAVAKTVSSSLLKPGGIGTTNNYTGQQWDAPNGWAPVQWIAVAGFANYKNKALSKTIARRWIALNEKVYQQTGKMMEKYNVEDLDKEAGGGEYESQDGYGWTNGVFLALKKYLLQKK